LFLWGVAEPCWSRGSRVGDTATCPVNSGRRQQIVTLINLLHSSFTVRQYTTVKEVRLHSKRGKATVTRVVGIVATMPCCDMGVTAPITSRVRAPCVGSLVLIRWSGVWRPSPGRVGRDGTYARGPGGRARRCLCLILGGSDETELAPEASGVGRAVFWARDRGSRWAGARVLVIIGGLLCLLRFFIVLIWVSLFMVPNSSPWAF